MKKTTDEFIDGNYSNLIVEADSGVNVNDEFALQQKSLRYNNGKVQLREVDPDFILGIGEVLTKSRDKYPAFNWCNATPFSVPYESLMRHLMAFQKGEDFDVESGKHHLLHVATNVMFMYYQYLNHPEMDDRGFKKEKK